MKTSELRDVVAIMRELGVIQAFGIILGPPPTKLEALQNKARDGASPELEQEIAQEIREQRRAALFDEYREKLAATGRDYSEAELARIIPQERLRGLDA